MSERAGPRLFDRLFSLVSGHPWAIILVFAVLCAVAVYVQSVRATYDMSYRTMAPRNTPEALEFERFVEVFGEATDVFFIGLKAEPLITAENLAMIERITRFLEEDPLTDSVTSLTNAHDILGDRGTLEVAKFVEEIPEGEAELRALELRLRSDPLLANGLISADGTTAAIMVRVPESRRHTG